MNIDLETAASQTSQAGLPSSLHGSGRQRADVASQSGFTLISALFLLVVVSGLAAYMVNLATAQHTSNALSIQHARAYYAAISGLEWAAFEIRSNPGSCPAVPTSFNADGFTITLSACTRSTVTESGISDELYDITVDAMSGSFGDIGFVSRSIRATLSE